MKRRYRWQPAVAGTLILLAAQIVTFLSISRENAFLKKIMVYIPPQPPGEISFWPPQHPPTPPPGEVAAPAAGSLGPIVIYIALVVLLLGIVLFLVPVSALKYLLRTVFALLFSWGMFILLILWLPWLPTLLIAVAVGTIWLIAPRVWFHNLMMIGAMASVGTVFGRLITPWTAMVLVLILAVYDFLAVRIGYMVWMTKRLSQSVSLPGFIIPRRVSELGSSLRQSGVVNLVDEDPLARKFSVLGGGDVGFSLVLMSAVFFGYGFAPALLMAAATLLGLFGAYWLQAVILRGKPIPALPPIAVASFLALTIIAATFRG